jgi:hypothetical protein
VIGRRAHPRDEFGNKSRHLVSDKRVGETERFVERLRRERDRDVRSPRRSVASGGREDSASAVGI